MGTTYTWVLPDANNRDVAHPFEDSPGRLQRIASSASVGAAIGTAVPIPGVGSTVGTVVGGGFELVRGIFTSSRSAANEVYQSVYETVFSDILGSGNVRALGDTNRGSGTIELQGQYRREDIEPVLQDVKNEIIRLSSQSGNSGRNARAARGLRLVTGRPVPGTPRMANRDLSIVIFTEPTRVDTNGNRTDEQAGASRGGVQSGGSLAGLAALAAGLLIFR